MCVLFLYFNRIHPLYLNSTLNINLFSNNIQVWTHKCAVQKASVMSIFHIINLKKKNHGHGGPGFFFNKELILDYSFCLKSGPVFLFQIFIIAPSPSQGIYNCIINNKLINNKFRFSI